MLHLSALTLYDEITTVALIPLLVIALVVLTVDVIRRKLDKHDVPFFVATLILALVSHSRDDVVRIITFTRGLANADADPVDHVLLLPETFFMLKLLTLLAVLVHLGVRWARRGAAQKAGRR